MSVLMLAHPATWANPLALLEQEGVHAMMRHATAPGFGDPDGFKLGDCSTQRNLSEAGLMEAQQWGNTFKQHNIRFTGVYSSQWCRCLHTARSMDVGEVRELPALNSFFENRANENTHTRAALAFLNGLKATDKVLLVTHQVNITALTGIFPAPGEVILFKIRPDAGLEVLGRIKPQP
ncbi:histidine phosphatase family protein [Limnobacter sp.]|uniref:histidine phosphatase family protein n=1 Tax=Limnobacter sp. TaxID=2003368 RepID=UPI003512981B